MMAWPLARLTGATLVRISESLPSAPTTKHCDQSLTRRLVADCRRGRLGDWCAS